MLPPSYLKQRSCGTIFLFSFLFLPTTFPPLGTTSPNTSEAQINHSFFLCCRRSESCTKLVVLLQEKNGCLISYRCCRREEQLPGLVLLLEDSRVLAWSGAAAESEVCRCLVSCYCCRRKEAFSGSHGCAVGRRRCWVPATGSGRLCRGPIGLLQEGRGATKVTRRLETFSGGGALLHVHDLITERQYAAVRGSYCPRTNH